MPEQRSDETQVADAETEANTAESTAADPGSTAEERPPVQPPAADERLLAAHDLARAALLEITPEPTVGKVVGHVVEGEHVLSLLFECTMSGYPGWRWTVSLARVDADSDPVVLEAELLPGDDALLAPDWVPWSERLAEYQAAQEAARAADAGEGRASDSDSDDDDDDDDDLDDAESDDDDEEDDLDDDELDEEDDLDHDDDIDGIDIDLHDEDDAEDDDDADEDEDDDVTDDIDVEANDIAGAEAASLDDGDDVGDDRAELTDAGAELAVDDQGEQAGEESSGSASRSGD
jgi:hypothetical protein